MVFIKTKEWQNNAQLQETPQLQCSICRGLEGLTPFWCLSTPHNMYNSLIITLFCYNTDYTMDNYRQKYIADPPLVFPQIEYCSVVVILNVIYTPLR